MERISAACAMEWSIELEKALRSRKPGLSVQAILKMRPRLVQWSGEPEPSKAVYDMFGLLPGEDRLFANTILLRLVDAFKSGDKHIRLSVVKVFLSEYRQRRKKKKTKQFKGILSKGRLHNHVEMFKRAKLVFDTGDVESRALALILFGCWVEFAKDNAHIRYLILSSLVSSDVLEVKASLFAAGCFCELADDFAAVVLEILLNLMASSSTLAVRLAAARIFTKMGCSYSTANKAYETGLKMLSGSSDEDFLTAMLISLSKLASKSTLLLPKQVDLVLSFLSRERTLRMRATALRCLHFLTTKGAYHPVSASVIKTLVGIADDHGLPATMQCEVLQIWHKMILYTSPDVPCDDIHEFSHLFAIFENSTEPPILSKRLLAARILTDVFTKLRRKTGTGFSKVGSPPMSLQVISLTVDQIIFLLKSLLEQSHSDFRELQQVQSLLIPLFSLVGENPDLGVLVLDKICTFIESLMDIHSRVMAASEEGSLVQDTQVPERRKSRAIVLKLVCFVYAFLVNFLENLYEAGGINTQVLEKLKILVECVHRCKLFNCYIHTLYSLLLHYQTTWGCMLHGLEENCIINKTSVIKLQNYLVEPEVFCLECAKKMFEEHDNWSAYKVGKYAACQGAWVTATFIFMELMKKVQSDFFRHWLKSLAQFAYSEWKIKLLLLPNQGSSSVDWLEMKEFTERHFFDGFGEIHLGATGNIDQFDCTEVVVEAYNVLCSSREILESSCTMHHSFSFQLWFMSKRAKVLETVADTIKLLDSIPSDKDNLRNTGNVKEQFSVELLNILRQLTQISLRLKRLAQEFDLMVSSFIGMDSRSSVILDALALSCSLLAFSAGFACFFPNLLSSETFSSFGVEISGSCLHAMLTQDLAGRLWHVDSETCTDLSILSEACAQPKNCFHWQSRSRMFNVGGMRDTLTVCRDAVSHFLRLQNQANKMQEEITFHVIEDGLQLLSNILMKWICIPFRIPKYYFEVRPCIGSELFAFNAGSSIPNEISVVPGFHLSFNLCLQLRNVPPHLSVSLTKLYCILCCRVSLQEPRLNGQKREPAQQYSQPWKDENEMVELNEKLFCHVAKCSKRSHRGKPACDNDVESGTVNTFLSFELSERGQGFSSCLLDVSHFPLGSYRIKWHSCCIDKRGRYRSLLPLNGGPVFEVRNPVVG